VWFLHQTKTVDDLSFLNCLYYWSRQLMNRWNMHCLLCIVIVNSH
jgi:hypothetical protein